jgi:predicted ATPase/DNA-binding CsgD family transcriptional regulator
VQELDTIVRSLATGEARLLTLTGPAGVGKTRLALVAAAQLAEDRGCFPDGVTLVDLAPIRDPDLVLGAIARGLGQLDVGGRPTLERLAESLVDRRQLVVLDNVEQVLPAAASLSDLLAACAGLALLVTSRAPLRLRWEQTLRVAPLPVPDLSAALPPPDELFSIPSVALFVGRARAHRADFAFGEQQAPLVAHLVAQLDGLPLALELAAARLDVLPLPTRVRRLGDRLELLASQAPDAPKRQRSLEAAVGWSYDLLSAPEQRLFRCLGVFVGRVTLDAIATVESVVGAGGGVASEGAVGEERETGRTLRQLLSLAEKSLVLPARPEGSGGQEASPSEPEQLEDDEPAFGMLETVREYAWERLAAAGELDMARRAHAYYYLELAERADHALRGAGQRAWFFRLEREQDNLRAALRWLLDQDERVEREAALRLAGGLGWFWFVRGRHAEGRRWLEEALSRALDADPGVRTGALVAVGALLWVHAEYTRARAVLQEGLALAERRRDTASAATALTYLGISTVLSGERAEAARLLLEALRRREALDDPQGLGLTLFYLGYAADAAGDYADAAARYTDALTQFAAADDVQHAGFVHCHLGVVEWRRGELPGAAAHVQAGVRTGVALQDRWILSWGVQAAVALIGARAEPNMRARLLGAADALAQATGATLAWERVAGGQDVAGLRARLTRGEEEEGELVAAYHEGRKLPFGAVATLTLQLLENLARPLSDRTASPAGAPAAAPASQHTDQRQSPLTAREQEVLRLVAEGRSSKEIGRRLFLSPSTVNHHIQSIFNKLGVDTRAQAVAVAAQQGLL